MCFRRRRRWGSSHPPLSRTALVASGNLSTRTPAGPIHYGKGKVTVYENAVFLEPDFEVGPGPAFHVYLVPKASIRTSANM